MIRLIFAAISLLAMPCAAQIVTSPALIPDSNGDGKIQLISRAKDVTPPVPSKTTVYGPCNSAPPYTYRVRQPCATAEPQTAPVAAPATRPSPPVVWPRANPRLGVNFSGLETSIPKNKPDALGFTHKATSARDIDLAIAEGMTFGRIPLRGTRVLPKLGGEVNAPEVAAIKGVGDRFLAKPGNEIMLDWHDYGRRDGVQYGTAPYDASAIADGYIKVLTAAGYLNNDRVIIGLQNEPHLAKDWWNAAQAVVIELRRRGVTNWVSVSGSGYSTASQFERLQWPHIATFVDSLKRTYFEAHAYHDKGGAGIYTGCVAGSESRIIAAIRSAEARGYRIIIGETNWGADSKCNVVREKVIAAIKASPAVHAVSFWSMGDFVLFPRYIFGLTGPTKGQRSVLFDRILREWRK